MFLRSRLQFSSPFKLIPKPPCSGEKNLPALENARKFVARWVWSIYLPQDVTLPNSEWAHCWEAAPAFLCREPVQGRCLVAEGSADWQGLGDLSCMKKSNHAAPALGYYFSTRGCVRISSRSGQSWNCHSNHFTRLHGTNQVIVALGDFNGNVYLGLRRSQSSTYMFQILVISDGPAKSQSSRNCAGNILWEDPLCKLQELQFLLR